MSRSSHDPLATAGEKFTGSEREIEVGRQNFLAYRQAGGGDYVADPGVQRYVQQVGERLAAVSDRPLPFEFVVINDSTPNAWALPGGKIAVNRGLLVEMQSEAELAAVLAHEIVHAAAGHGADGMELDLLLGGALALGRIALAGRDYGGAALAGAQIGAGLFARSYGRDAEREADHYGIRYMRRAGYDPRAAVALQQTFVRLARGRDPGWLAGLFASHPPSQERVENNRRSVAELGAPGGDIGRDRHQRAIARLLRTREAYASYDRAVEAFAHGDGAGALALVDEALAVEPAESLFHGLRGTILAAQGAHEQAGRSLDRAIALNPRYFRHYAARGALRRDRGDRAGARRDLEASVSLLPTARAQHGLGLFALHDGDTARAIELFREAARGDSPVAEDALAHLARLDLADNPHRYVDATVALDADGFLRVVVDNATPVDVAGLRVAVGARRVLGMRVRGEYDVDGPVPARRRVSVRTDLGPFDADKARHYVARVVQARVVE